MTSALPQYGKNLHPHEKMRALVIEQYGKPDVLKLASVPRPITGPGQALVRIRFAGVNPKDVVVRKGKFKTMTGRRFPLILGNDLAGEVVESGPEADLSVGEPVYGMINHFVGKAYAEFAAVDCNQLGRVPSSIDLKSAAAVPLAAQTALQALRDLARVQAATDVLINGASGGVGVFAVQIARILGANVTAVCSARNEKFVDELGAQYIVDYNKTDLASITQRFDTVFDVFGNYCFDQLKHLLKPRGIYIHTIPSFKTTQDMIRTFARKQKAKTVFVRSRREQLDWLSEHLDAGLITVPIERTFPLKNAPEAHRFVETKRTRGKIVLEVDVQDSVQT